MGLNNIIQKLNLELIDIKKHKADYCSISVEDVEAILEYLEQLKEIAKEN